jgi:sugar (pentulose or hexulose) kinase
MTNRIRDNIGRRGVLCLFTGGAAMAAGTAGSCTPSAAVPESNAVEEKARYQPNSPDVENFYRVNRYPQK